MVIYGTRDARRGFWLSLKDEVVKQPEVHEVTGELALYSATTNGQLHGCIATHLDDVLWSSDPIVDEVMERVQKRFTFGSVDEGSLRYCGRSIEDKETYIEISSSETLRKAKPIYMKDGRQRKPSDKATGNTRRTITDERSWEVWDGFADFADRSSVTRLRHCRDSSVARRPW